MKRNFSIRFDRVSLLLLLALLLENRIVHTTALLLSALVHECGHLLASRFLHISITSLHISILGARLELEDPLLSYRQEWLLCAAGPLFSFLFAWIGAWCVPGPLGEDMISVFAMTSMALGIVNLLPVGWLDGGRMFRAMCLLMLPHRVASRLIRLCSLTFVLLLWTVSVYLLLRVGNSLSLFVFSFSLFLRFFLTNSITNKITAYAKAYIGAITHAVRGVPDSKGSAIWNASLISKVCIKNAPTVI